MKKFILLCMTILLIFALGCGKAADNTTSTSPDITTEAQNDESPTIFSTTSELDTTPKITLEAPPDISTPPYVEIKEEEKGIARRNEIRGEGDSQRLGVNKTLVCVCYNHLLNIPSAESINALNEMLVNEYGCDFTVELHIYSEKAHSKYYYYDVISDLLQSGQQIDVLSSGSSRCYTEFVKDGVFEPLSPYLESEAGEKLWNIYPEELWIKTTRNNEIYGIAQTGMVGERIVLDCEKSVAEKYNITLPERCSFYDLETILKDIEAVNGADAFKDVIPIIANNFLAPIYMDGYYIEYALGNIGYRPEGGRPRYLLNAIYFKKDNNGNWLAVNPAKEEAIISLMKQIKKYVDKGWYVSGNGSILTKSNHVFSLSEQYNYEQIVDKKVAFIDGSNSEIWDIIIGNTTYLPYSALENYVTGIASCSQYKDEAFKLLLLLNTEEKLSNLLMFGIEGKDWEYKDNKLFDLETGNEIMAYNDMYAAFSNINLIPSTYLDPEDKVAGIRELSSKHEASPLITHNIDVSAYTEKMKTINAIYCAYMGKLLVGEYEDIDGVMAQMNSMLEEAGINEIIDDINRQMQQ
ncbi:MAG: DUF3502 domain-containing protein [Lachnospiraceae bacterium]|nr:DUF3502 domain-containing protein [Lachnospiraceae bacterium]